MIEMTMDHVRNLKNIRQIGTPSEDNKIYMEDHVYRRLHQDDFRECHVYVFMGHTECKDGYATFIEGVIPVTKMIFEQNLPIWTNQAWSEVFHKIRECYEDSIIVGWAIDIKGFAPKMTEKLEQIHREEFGGVHQMLLLMDSLEQEECFYVRKQNHLCRQTGFYIYYNLKRKEEKPSVEVEVARHLPIEQYMSEEQSLAKKKKRNGIFMLKLACFISLLGVMVFELYMQREKYIDASTTPIQVEQPSESERIEETETAVESDWIPVEIVPAE